MADGMTVAAISMLNDMDRMAQISQNVANINTPAYKRSVPINSSFTTILTNANQQALALPVPNLGASTDMRVGTLKPTGNPFDLAIENGGFFEIERQGQRFYTRLGNFKIDAKGQLLSAAGDVVMGSNGTLILNTLQPVIGRDGVIKEKDKIIGQLKLVHFKNPEQLQAMGQGVFAQGDAQMSSGATKLRQGYLEASNVNNAQEMTQMIETIRHFETGQKVIQIYDEMNERAITKLGEF